MLNEGSVALPYEPYENICPISGWTGLNGTRTGKNLLRYRDDIRLPRSNDGITYTYENDGYRIHVSGTTSSSFLNLTNRLMINPNIFHGGETIYISSGSKSGNINMQLHVDNVSVFNSPEGIYTFPQTFDDWYFRLRLNDVTVDETVEPFICFASEQDRIYEPYHSTDITINWQSAAGEVYGGTLDVVSGKMRITDAEIASYNGETLSGEWISDLDIYVLGTSPSIGAQVVYKLAEPVEYQLTPQQITCLSGVNNIWVDTGDVTVTYPVDTKTYIDRKIQEAVDGLSGS